MQGNKSEFKTFFQFTLNRLVAAQLIRFFQFLDVYICGIQMMVLVTFFPKSDGSSGHPDILREGASIAPFILFTSLVKSIRTIYNLTIRDAPLDMGGGYGAGVVIMFLFFVPPSANSFFLPCWSIFSSHLLTCCSIFSLLTCWGNFFSSFLTKKVQVVTP